MCHRVVSQVDALGLFELIGQIVYHHRIQIVTAKMSITVGA